MDEQQAFSAIRNTIRLENLSSKAAAKVSPELVEIFRGLKAEIERFPEEAILREMRYKQLFQQLGAVLQGPNNHLYQSISETLRDEVEHQAEWAAKYVGAELPEPVGISTGVPAGEGPVSLGAGAGVTRTQLMALADDSKVLGKRLDQLFGAGEDGRSPWTATQMKTIDRVVKQGFLTGQTNQEIAKSMATALNGSIKQNSAIARTAVMDMSQRAHERMWDANKDRIAGWEFDASMDDRVCPTCAPFDGRTAKERDLLPTVPVHVNCRCRKLPLTRTELALRESEGPQRRSVTELVEASSKEEAEKIAARDLKQKGANITRTKAYAKQVRVDGKKYWRVAADVEQKSHPLTMGEYLANANPTTRAKVLESKKRADKFMNLISDKGKSTTPMSPDAALAQVTKGVRPAFKEGTRSVLESPAVKGFKKKKAPVVKPRPKTPAPQRRAKARTVQPKREGPPTVDVSQMRRAAPGGEYGPDGHFYPGGSFMPDGNFVGQKQPLGTGDRPAIKAADQVKPADVEPRVVRQRENKSPRPYVPSSATGLEAPANKLSKLQQRRQTEFFDKQGFLSEDIAIAARKAGPDGRSPIDNTNFISVLANRADRNWLESKIKDIRRVITDKSAFGYAMEDSDFISRMEFAGLTRGMSAVDEGHWAAARRLQQAVFELAGQRVAKKKGSRRARHHNEEMIWIMNNVFMTKRRG